MPWHVLVPGLAAKTILHSAGPVVPVSVPNILARLALGRADFAHVVGAAARVAFRAGWLEL